MDQSRTTQRATRAPQCIPASTEFLLMHYPEAIAAFDRVSLAVQRALERTPQYSPTTNNAAPDVKSSAARYSEEERGNGVITADYTSLA